MKVALFGKDASGTFREKAFTRFKISPEFSNVFLNYRFHKAIMIDLKNILQNAKNWRQRKTHFSLSKFVTEDGIAYLNYC